MGCVLAQMAELVDALVSNTNEVTLVPVRLRLWVQIKSPFNRKGIFFTHSLSKSPSVAD